MRTTRRPSVLEALWVLILAAYAVLFAWLVLARRLGDLVHPRMTPFAAGAAVVLATMAVVQAVRLFRPPARLPGRPVMALFLLPLAAVPVFVASEGAGRPAVAAPGSSIAAAFSPVVPQGAPRSTARATIPATGSIVVNQDTYYAVYSALLDNPAAYEGRRLDVTGFVSTASPLGGTGRFLAGRELMWCCIVDLTTIGYVCEFHGWTIPPDDTWVMVSGTLSTTTIAAADGSGSSVLPLLVVDRLQVMDGYDYTYVYPLPPS